MKTQLIFLLSISLLIGFNDSTAQSQNALNLDGVDDQVVIPDDPSLDLVATDTLSFELWFNTVTDDLGHFLQKVDSVSSSSGYFAAMTSEGNITFGKGGFLGEYAQVITSIGGFNDGQWHHLAVVAPGINAENYLIYIDGNLVANNIDSNNFSGSMINDSPLVIGRFLNANYNGTIDEFRLWNKMRTQSEIQTDMNNEITGNEEGLIAYYNFNQGIANENNITVNTLIDLSPNSNTGSLDEFLLNGTSSNWVDGFVGTDVGIGIVTNDFSTELLVYPNPTDGNFSVDLGETHNSAKITITDLNGKITQSNLCMDQSLLNIQMDEEPAGVYFLKIETGDHKAVIRLIKE